MTSERRYHLSIDIGASSGRHIVGYVEDGKIILQEVYRFDNSQIVRSGHECWNLTELTRHVLAGIRAVDETQPLYNMRKFNGYTMKKTGR